jgi:hypothetical protein
MSVDEPAIDAETWEQIDSHLAQGEILPAIMLYRRATGFGIAEAKSAIGERFRERFPQRWAGHRNICDEDWPE